MQAGWSKNIITPNIFGTMMMGYANDKNIIKGKATELYCRCVWLKGDSFQLLYLYLDINYITTNLYSALVAKIQNEFDILESEIHICASHTHSAHGNYGDKLYYETPTYGFREEIFKSYVDKSFAAVVEASKKFSEVDVTYGAAEFQETDKVAFNRSLESFYRNPEAKGDETIENALNLQMDQIQLKKEGSSAVINWFGCHTTSIPNFMTNIHFDNKGYACKFMEEYLGKDSVAIFAQATSGDVTPNFCWDSKTGQMRGPFEDYDKNARFNGELQFLKSREIYEGKQSKLDDSILIKKEIYCFRDLKSKDGTKSLAPASFGTSFMGGTLEGPGVSKTIVFVVSWLLNLLRSVRLGVAKIFNPEFYKYQLELMKHQGEKNIFLNVSDRQFAAMDISRGIPLLGHVDAQVSKLNHLLKREMYQKAHSWYEENLPLQLIAMDYLLIVALPFELTTMSGRRVKEALKKTGNFKNIILNTYSNAYAGYITTPEEYENQSYEGGHTVFGKASLPILIETLEDMCSKLKQA